MSGRGLQPPRFAQDAARAAAATATKAHNAARAARGFDVAHLGARGVREWLSSAATAAQPGATYTPSGTEWRAGALTVPAAFWVDSVAWIVASTSGSYHLHVGIFDVDAAGVTLLAATDYVGSAEGTLEQGIAPVELKPGRLYALAIAGTGAVQIRTHSFTAVHPLAGYADGATPPPSSIEGDKAASGGLPEHLPWVPLAGGTDNAELVTEAPPYVMAGGLPATAL